MFLFSNDLGVDLGTSNVLIYADGKGLVVREPSVVAMDKNTGKILQVGAAARNMLGRTPGNVVAMHPLKDGTVSDHEMTVRMLQEMFKTATKASFFTPKPRVVISVPSGVSEVEERSVAAIVMLSNGQSAWKLSTDGIWLEPVELSVVTADNGVQAYDVQAKDAAAQAGVVYVSEVSAALSPQAGDKCTDAGLLGLIQYVEGFSSALSDQIVSASATSKESIAVVLSNGIKVSLGAPDDIALKEQTVLGILDKFQGQISYINVRTPANPTYRGLTEGTATQDGTTASADALPYQAQAGSATTPDTATSSADAATDGSTATSDSDVPSDAAYNGGYYLSDGETWVNYYYEDGNLVHGYYKVD